MITSVDFILLNPRMFRGGPSIHPKTEKSKGSFAQKLQK